MKAPNEEIYSKSTICDFLYIPWPLITYGLQDIFGCRGLKSPFSPTVFWLHTPSGETPSNINLIYTSLKSTFSGLQLCRRQYRSIFIRLAVVAYQICEITRNSQKFEHIAVQGHPRSSTLVPIESAYATSY